MAWQWRDWMFRGGPVEPWLRAAGLLVSQGFAPRIRGRRHVPRRGGLLVFSTHGGGPDFSYLVAGVPRPLRAVVLAKSLRRPVLGWILRLRGAYRVESSGLEIDRETLDELRRAATDAADGAVVALFPQGVGRQVKGGAVWLAAHAGVPVLPVFTYRIWSRDGQRRALVWVRPPVAPPGLRAAERRAFRDRFQRRMERAGASRGDRDTRALMDVALADREPWRDPRRVIRLAARVHRLPAARRRRLGRRARLVVRAARRLRCSPDAFRRPPDLREVAGALVVAPLALCGLVLCAPALLVAAWGAARARGRRAVDRHVLGTALAVPWALTLAGAGLLLFSAPGLLLPPLAGAGMLACGLFKRFAKPLRAEWRVRRHRGRFAPHVRLLDRRLRAPARRGGGERVPRSLPIGARTRSA